MINPISKLLSIGACCFLFQAWSQCTLTVLPQPTAVSCGDTVNIVLIPGVAESGFTDDFSSGTLGINWSSTQNIDPSNPCGPSLDGTASAWMGSLYGAPRKLTTIPFDFSCGGSVCFDLDFGGDDPCGGCTDCEDPDAAPEGVYLQYSTNGGTSWNDIFYFQPNTTNTGPYYQWNNYCFDLPPAAWTPNTMIQWNQAINSTNGFDHWGIDNVQLIGSNCNTDAGYYFTWDGNVGPGDSSLVVVDNTPITILYTNGVDDTCSYQTTFSTISLDAGYSYGQTSFCSFPSTVTPLITGDSGVFTATGGLTIDPATGEFNPSTELSGNYDITYTVSNGLCSVDSTITIQIGGFTLDAGPNVYLCEGIPMTLNAFNPDGAIISWNGGVVDGVPFTPPLGASTYTVSGSMNGCTVSDNTTIFVSIVPTVFAGNDTSIYSGQPITLTAYAPDGGAITWTGGVINGVSFIPPVGVYEYFTTCNLNGCSSTDAVVVTVLDDIGFNEQSDADLLIYPNPAHDKFTINMKGNYSLLITDAAGKVLRKSTEAGNCELNLEDESRGVYFVTIVQGENTIVRQVVLE